MVRCQPNESPGIKKLNFYKYISTGDSNDAKDTWEKSWS